MRRELGSYAVKVILVMIVVSGAPVLIGIAFNLNVFVQKSVDLVHAKHENELVRTGMLMDNMLRQISELANAMQHDKEYVRTEMLSGQYGVLERLNWLKHYSPYIQNVVLYNENNNYLLVSAYGIVRNADQSELAAAIRDIPDMGLFETRMAGPYTYRGNQVAAIVAKLPVEATDRNAILVLIDMEGVYSGFLRQLNIDPEVYNYYLTDAEGTVLYHRETGWIGQSRSELPLEQSRVERHTYELDSFNWSLVSEVNLHELYLEVDALKKKLYILILVEIGCILILIVMGSRELVRPFGKIWNQVKMSEEVARRTLLQRLIKDPFAPRHHLDAFLSGYAAHAVVVVFTIRDGDDAEVSLKPDELQRRLELSTMPADYFVEANRELIGLFQVRDLNINQFLTELLVRLDPVLVHQLDLSVGSIHPLPDVHKSYVEAMYAFNIGRLYTPDMNIFCYSKLPMDYHDTQTEVPRIEELEMAIRQQNERAYVEALNALLSEQLTMVEYNHNFYQIVSLLLRLYGKESVPFLHELNRLIGDKGLMNVTFIKQFFMSKFKSFDKAYDRDTKSYATKVDAFIAERYADNLSLDEMAEAVGISKQHMIQVFKQTYNRTPGEYLNEYRIEKAKQLLASQESRIADIGQAVGFNSNSYFAKVFKQHTGITASDYRELLHNRHAPDK